MLFHCLPPAAFRLSRAIYIVRIDAAEHVTSGCTYRNNLIRILQCVHVVERVGCGSRFFGVYTLVLFHRVYRPTRAVVCPHQNSKTKWVVVFPRVSRAVVVLLRKNPQGAPCVMGFTGLPTSQSTRTDPRRSGGFCVDDGK